MPDATPRLITVLDFRRRRMMVRWNIGNQTGTPEEEASGLVHGLAYMRPSQSPVCVFGQGGNLLLQVNGRSVVLYPGEPRVRCRPQFLTAGLRRIFRIEDRTGGTLYVENYWAGTGPDFFRLLSEHCTKPGWRSHSALSWSDGIDPGELRQSWSD